jgi:hypothetical protein
LTEHAPSSGEAHGCPYRHFTIENLAGLLRASGVTDHAVLKGVKEDTESQKFHMACNRYVFLLFCISCHVTSHLRASRTRVLAPFLFLFLGVRVYVHSKLTRAVGGGVTVCLNMSTGARSNGPRRRAS